LSPDVVGDDSDIAVAYVIEIVAQNGDPRESDRLARCAWASVVPFNQHFRGYGGES
jgi:hypothetical protein